MQRWNCVALFAALAIGFGAATAHADATVESVVVKLDSGAVVGIGQEFEVTAVIRDFTPHDNDAVIFYLTQADSTGAVRDSTETDVEFLTGDDASEDTRLVDPTGTAAGGIINSALDGESLSFNDEGGGTPGGGTGNFVVAFAQRKTAKAAAEHLDGDDKDKALPDAAKIIGDGAYIRLSGTKDDPDDQTTYTWKGIVHHASGTVESIRAAVLVEDWEPVEGPDDVATTDVDESTDEVFVPRLVDKFEISVGPIVSGDDVTFTIDADRPLNPMEITSVALAELNDDDEYVDATTEVLGLKEDDTAKTVVGGIDDRVRVSVKLGSDRARQVVGDHSLRITIDDKKFTASEAAADRKLDTFNFSHVIAAKDFGDIIAKALVIKAHVVDPAGNASCEVRDNSGNVDRDKSDACGAAILAADDVLDDGQDSKPEFRLDATAPDATKDSLLVVKGRHLRAQGDTLTDGTVNPGFQDDLNALFYDVPEALGKLEIIIKAPGAKDDTGTNLTVTGSGYTHAALGNSRVGEAERVEFKFVAAGAATVEEEDDRTKGTGSLGGTVADLTGPGSGGKVGTTETDHPAFADGMKTVKVTATDLAGNTGPSQEYSVYMDASDVTFGDVFPEAGIATLEAETAKVRFKLSEDADSVLISYEETQAKGSSGDPEGNDEDSPRTFDLTGDDLLNNSSYQRKAVSGLVDDTHYELSLPGCGLGW